MNFTLIFSCIFSMRRIFRNGHLAIPFNLQKDFSVLTLTPSEPATSFIAVPNVLETISIVNPFFEPLKLKNTIIILNSLYTKKKLFKIRTNYA